MFKLLSVKFWVLEVFWNFEKTFPKLTGASCMSKFQTNYSITIFWLEVSSKLD